MIKCDCCIENDAPQHYSPTTNKYCFTNSNKKRDRKCKHVICRERDKKRE